eukprot:14290312-Alexandrium_andersonii.AAC.1
MSRGSMVPCKSGSLGGVVPRAFVGFQFRTWTCARTWGVVRGCVISMFTEPWVNISDVSRCIELQAFMFRPGALSP